jgi:hypothetical protein
MISIGGKFSYIGYTDKTGKPVVNPKFDMATQY